MEKLENLLNRYWIFAILIISIPAVWALFVPGFYGASDDIHIAWLYELHKTLMMGQVPPRFVPDLSFGFGYPLFNFVFPLPFYMGEIFHLLRFSFVDSIKAVFFISVPLSGIFMFMLLRQFTKIGLSLVGAILYIYTPYRSVDIYIRGAIGEITSFIFLPLIILSVVKISRTKGLRWVGIGGLSLASLVLSHNIAAYMFLPYVFIFFLMQFFLTPKKVSFLTKSFLMIFLGLLVSIYFWLPALAESSLMKYDAVFNFVDHFPTLKQLITPYWGYGASVPGPGDGMSFFLGLASILILTWSIIVILFRWKTITNQKKLLIFWVLSAITTAIFLMNYRSTFIWNNLPFLPYFQFPWRFLILTTFFIPLLVVTLENKRFEKYLWVMLLGLIILPGMSYFRPQDFLGRKDEYFINKYIPLPLASEEYKKTQEEYLRLPKVTEKRPDRNYSLVTANSGTIQKIEKVNDLNVLISFTSTSGATINYNKYFFPGWVAEVDGLKKEIFVGKPFGQISINVSGGEHFIKIAFKETNLRIILDAISLAGFLVSLGMCFKRSINRTGLSS